jgi:hypothetical protein
MRCLLPTRSRSIVIVLVDLDVVVDLDGDGDVDRDAPSWTVRSSSSACAAVSFRPAPRAFGKVAHDGLRGTSESVSASTTARRACRRGRRTRWRVGRRSPRRRRSQGPRPRKLPQQQRRAAFRRASCTEHPHSASTSSDGQLLAVHGRLATRHLLPIPATRTPSRTTPPARERAPPSDWDCVNPGAPDDGPDDDVGVMGERRARADRGRAAKMLGVWLGTRRTGALRVRDAAARGADGDAFPTAHRRSQPA